MSEHEESEKRGRLCKDMEFLAYASENTVENAEKIQERETTVSDSIFIDKHW